MEKLLTINQLSELLQIKKSTIYCWTFSKRIPYVKLHGTLRFRQKDISKWLDDKVEETKNF
ncbi:MAG: helix-turn-helix domain-containing protein [Deltaproteobacteria bacterium]|nr:helix-turn-helix domain-containing protein [Deltaproteobacteria bacterium]MBW2183790.1 helix-turn-helix domain-containing protein [Deltaproteobacteria bacterium]